jgi:hypothetical protein
MIMAVLERIVLWLLIAVVAAPWAAAAGVAVFYAWVHAWAP